MRFCCHAVFLGLLSGTAFASNASADAPACLAAATRAQQLRRAHQLLESRDQLRICAAAVCPSVVQGDCATWLAEVEKALPGVIVSAKNRAGVDLIDVKVTVDGEPFLTRLDGQTKVMNAGAHIFHFEASDGSSVDQQVLVREGDKSQTVAVILGAAVPGAATAPEPKSSQPSVWRTVGWVAGGVGLAGIVVGAISGIVAVSDKSAAHCTSDVCDPGTVSGIKTAANVSNVGWIAGGVLLAGGVGLVIFAPRDSTASTSGVRLVPAMTASGGQLVIGGAF
jgi:hypothetical protein